jgi:hypothetical protein
MTKPVITIFLRSHFTGRATLFKHNPRSFPILSHCTKMLHRCSYFGTLAFFPLIHQILSRRTSNFYIVSLVHQIASLDITIRNYLYLKDYLARILNTFRGLALIHHDLLPWFRIFKDLRMMRVLTSIRDVLLPSSSATTVATPLLPILMVPRHP